jgi:hypothetical protein
VVAKRLVVDDMRPTIPAFVLPTVQRLIRKCWKREPSRRPTFSHILNQLEAMEFKLTANVNSSKLSEFVKKVKDWAKDVNLSANGSFPTRFYSPDLPQ